MLLSMRSSLKFMLAHWSCTLTSVLAQVNVTSLSGNFSWTNIKPSADLQYHDCGGGFQCARLELPLDWNATKNDSWYDDKYNMAIVKIPAQVPVTDPRYGGPILINPGGPGGSGTEWALENGQGYQTAFDAAFAYNSSTYVSKNPKARYFDIIGFDPRAVGNSTPFYECISSVPYFQQLQLPLSVMEVQYPDVGLDYQWKLYTAISSSCIWDPARGPGGSKIANFSSTAMTARDLVEFAERNVQLRQGLGGSKWKKGEEPILYYGVSYGTLLGATLAAMQPHRVHRFVLDGVVNAQEYYANLYTSDAKQGTQAVEKFFEYCAMAGPKKCAMWNGHSTADTARRLQAIYDDLRVNGSIAVPQGDGVEADVISIGDVEDVLAGNVLYNPPAGFPTAANAIAPLTHRDGKALARQKQQDNDIDWLSLNKRFNRNDPASAYPSDGTLEVLWSAAIEGSDSSVRYTQQQFIDKVFTPLHNVTPWTADFDATEVISDGLWPIIAKWRFGGVQPIASNVTANPILFQSNLIDGVTSLGSAQVMHAAFRGSGLLLSNGEGHTTGAEVSLCLAQGTRYYFQTGKLPDTSKVCQVTSRPFLGRNGPGVAKIGHLDKENEVLLATQEYLVDNY